LRGARAGATKRLLAKRYFISLSSVERILGAQTRTWDERAESARRQAGPSTASLTFPTIDVTPRYDLSLHHYVAAEEWQEVGLLPLQFVLPLSYPIRRPEHNHDANPAIDVGEHDWVFHSVSFCWRG
jgi:hypothetical protein